MSVETVTLVNANIGSNTNKFYEATLNEDGSITVAWGRIRDGARPGSQSTTYYGGEKKFRQLIRAKERKGYSQIETLNTGAGKTTAHNFALDSIALQQIKGTDNPRVSTLVSFLVRQNLHSIMSNTTLKYDENSGLFRTPLGIVTESSLAEAELLLVEISKMVETGKYGTDEINRYLTLIPRDLGVRMFSANELFPDGDAIAEQRDLIDNLRTSLSMAMQAPEEEEEEETEVEVPTVFNLALGDPSDEDVTHITKWFDESNKSMHRRGHMKVAEVFTIEQTAAEFNESIGNVEQVWHGTGPGNILSIVRSGLRCSPPGSAAVTGKMFGHGIYGAKSSSKSINYCSSFWGGSQAAEAWLLVCNFAMGKVRSVDSSVSGPGNDYDSVWARAGKHLANDELIVYSDNQVQLTHLVKTTEF